MTIASILEGAADLVMGMKARIEGYSLPKLQPPFGLIGVQTSCGAMWPCLCGPCVRTAINYSDGALSPTSPFAPLATDDDSLQREFRWAPLPDTATVMDRVHRAEMVARYRRDREAYNARHIAAWTDRSIPNWRAHGLLMSLLTVGQRETWNACRAFWVPGSDGNWWIVGWANGGESAASRYSGAGLRVAAPTCITPRFATAKTMNAYDAIIAKKLAVEHDAETYASVRCGRYWDARGVITGPGY